MKICFCSTFLGHLTSGAEMSTHLVAQSLTNNHDVFAVTTSVSKQLPYRHYSLHMGAIPRIVLMISTPLTDWVIYSRLLSILQKEKPDVVHIHDFSIMAPALRAAKKLGIPTVMTVRDYRFHCNLVIDLQNNNLDYNYSTSRYYTWLVQTVNPLRAPFVFPIFHAANQKNKKLINTVDHLVTVSDFVGTTLQKCGITIPSTTIYVPKPDWQPKNIKVPLQLFCAGLLAKTKGFHVIID
jgi:glycosyltransferase involved in cell wall biosynthesis